MKKLLPFFVASLHLILIVTIAQAQPSGNCPELVEEALSSVNELCTTLDRNSACYGASEVDSDTIIDPRPDDFFVGPGDRANLLDLTLIRPRGLNTETGEFGVGVLNLQANLPNTLPGQGVIFMLIGQAELTNEPVINAEDDAPFRSFYFLPGIGQADCYESEPTLTIQTPGNISVRLMLNGVEREFAPGTLLTITDTVCTIHRGALITDPDGARAVLLANETVDIEIGEEGAISVLNARGISEREFERGQLIQTYLNELSVANDWPEQFIVEPTTFAEEPATLDTGTCDETHTVRAGNSFFSIAQQYDTSIQAILDANGLERNAILTVGQELCIPGVGSGFEALPPAAATHHNG